MKMCRRCSTWMFPSRKGAYNQSAGDLKTACRLPKALYTDRCSRNVKATTRRLCEAVLQTRCSARGTHHDSHTKFSSLLCIQRISKNLHGQLRARAFCEAEISCTEGAPIPGISHMQSVTNQVTEQETLSGRRQSSQSSARLSPVVEGEGAGGIDAGPRTWSLPRQPALLRFTPHFTGILLVF